MRSFASRVPDVETQVNSPRRHQEGATTLLVLRILDARRNSQEAFGEDRRHGHSECTNRGSLHSTRNLNEFFLEVGWDHALKASDFTVGDYKLPPNSEERKALIAKINKQISHLTDQRTLTAQQKIGERDRTALYDHLVADFKNFTQYLRPELRPMQQVF